MFGTNPTSPASVGCSLCRWTLSAILFLTTTKSVSLCRAVMASLMPSAHPGARSNECRQLCAGECHCWQLVQQEDEVVQGT